MFKIYYTNNDTSYPIKKYTKFDYIASRYRKDLNKVIDYYMNKDRAVNNSHILNRLITLIAPNINMSDTQYFEIVETTNVYIAKQFDIVSNINSGKIHENLFIGNNSYEILLYKETDIDLFEFSNNWRTYQSVKAIYNEDTALDFNVPFNNKDYIVPMLSIFEIDITAMLMQYKYWALERIKNDHSTNANVFISQIVLPNMLPSLLDFALYNRYRSLLNNEPIEDFNIRQPFILTDYSKGIDNIYKKVIKDTKNTSMEVDHLYETIPMIYVKNAYELLHVTNKYYTKQSEWVLVLSRIPIIKDTLVNLGARGIAKNKTIINRLAYRLKEIERSKTIEHKLDNLTYIETNYLIDLDYIKDIVGRR